MVAELILSHRVNSWVRCASGNVFIMWPPSALCGATYISDVLFSQLDLEEGTLELSVGPPGGRGVLCQARVEGDQLLGV